MIHVGEKNHSNENTLNRIIENSSFKVKPKIIWKNGATVKALSAACKENEIDLLILGAIQNETFLNYYIGTVARKISRKPPCSLLLVVDPKREKNKLNSIVVNGQPHPKTPFSLNLAFEFAREYKVNDLFVVEEISPKRVKTKIEDNITLEAATKEKENILKSENTKMIELIKSIPQSKKLIVTKKIVFGRKGYSIGHFAEVKNADLLVLNSTDQKLGFLDRFFPHDLEFILSDLPCNLLIAHK